MGALCFPSPLISQSHVDMVTEKTPDKVFDFFTQGIDLVIDGEWLKVRGFGWVGAHEGGYTHGLCMSVLSYVMSMVRYLP